MESVISPFESLDGKSVSFTDHTLVIPSPESTGECATLGVDLMILNHGYSHVGYFNSDHITPLMGNDILSVGEPTGAITPPNAVYSNSDAKITLFAFRSGVPKGRIQEFVEEIENWVQEGGFKRIIILTSTYNQVRKIRVSNIQIPKLFYYENPHFGK